MPDRSSLTRIPRVSLLAGAAGLILAASSAFAQDNGRAISVAANPEQPPGYDQGPPPGYDQGPPPGYDQGPPSAYQNNALGPNVPSLAQEVVPVIASPFRSDRFPRAISPPGTMSLRVNVDYSDLDLRTRTGAHVLRGRIRAAADDTCNALALAYPVQELALTSCTHDARQWGLVRATRAINYQRENLPYVYPYAYDYQQSY